MIDGMERNDGLFFNYYENYYLGLDGSFGASICFGRLQWRVA